MESLEHIHEHNSPHERLKKLQEELGVTFEIIDNVPVFVIENDAERDHLIQSIGKYYGEQAVFRIINASFVDEAITHGTDKHNVERYDFRRVADWSGMDVWGVEEKAKEMGLQPSDSFCASSYSLFIEKEEEYKSTGLGIPDDRSAILIYDAEKLSEIEGTDGYVFDEPEHKKDALLAVIRFKEIPQDFEEKINELSSPDEKIGLLEQEVFQNLNEKGDLERTSYIALHIISLLYDESKTVQEGVERSSARERIEKLKLISDRLSYEIRMIEAVDNMQDHITMYTELDKKIENNMDDLILCVDTF